MITDVAEHPIRRALQKFWAPVPWMAMATLVFSGQAVFYVARERQHVWSSRPGKWLVVSSIVDILIIGTLASRGILMVALPVGILTGLFVAALAFAFVLDAIKLAVFRRLKVT